MGLTQSPIQHDSILEQNPKSSPTISSGPPDTNLDPWTIGSPANLGFAFDAQVVIWRTWFSVTPHRLAHAPELAPLRGPATVRPVGCPQDPCCHSCTVTTPVAVHLPSLSPPAWLGESCYQRAAGPVLWWRHVWLFPVDGSHTSPYFPFPGAVAPTNTFLANASSCSSAAVGKCRGR